MKTDVHPSAYMDNEKLTCGKDLIQIRETPIFHFN